MPYKNIGTIAHFMNYDFNQKYRAITYISGGYSITITRFGAALHTSHDGVKVFPEDAAFDEEKNARYITINDQKFNYDKIFYT